MQTRSRTHARAHARTHAHTHARTQVHQNTSKLHKFGEKTLKAYGKARQVRLQMRASRISWRRVMYPRAYVVCARVRVCEFKHVRMNMHAFEHGCFCACARLQMRACMRGGVRIDSACVRRAWVRLLQAVTEVDTAAKPSSAGTARACVAPWVGLVAC